MTYTRYTVRIRQGCTWRLSLADAGSQTGSRYSLSRIISYCGRHEAEGIGKYGLMLLFFWAISLFLSRDLLNAPFRGDDFHLIRTYSRSELRGIWTGPWDPDGIETPGFRPLTTVFNHLRGSFFGESVTGHRLLLLFMFSVYLTLAFGLVNRVVDLPYQQGLLGGLFVMLHTASVYHYFWITDGNRLLAGVLVVGSILLFLNFLASGRYVWLLASLLLYLLGLLTREESLLLLGLATLSAAAFLMKESRWTRRNQYLLRLGVCSLGLIAVTATYWYWRGIAVPNAVRLRTDLSGILWSVMQTIQNLGDSTHLIVWWREYVLLIWLWTLLLVFLAVVFLFLLPKSAQVRGAWLAGAMVIGAMPGLTFARTNLLLLAVTFWGFLLALTLIEFSKHSVPSTYIALAISVFVMWSSGHGSTTIAQANAPGSVDRIQGNTTWIYGELAHATIPDIRRAHLKQELGNYGVYSLDDFDAVISDLIEDARSNRRYDPDGDGSAFIPRFRFNLGPNWRAWSYVGREGWIVE